jgi:hypothetical protein
MYIVLQIFCIHCIHMYIVLQIFCIHCIHMYIVLQIFCIHCIHMYIYSTHCTHLLYFCIGVQSIFFCSKLRRYMSVGSFVVIALALRNYDYTPIS